MKRSCLSLISLVLVASFAPAALADDIAKRSYLGARMPEITSEEGTWLNSKEALTIEHLRGGPALIVYTAVW